MTDPPEVLATRDAYRLWAPVYDEETVVSALEDRTVRALGVSTEGRAVLDVGCGVGRRLGSEAGYRVAVGVDLVPEMLERARLGGARARFVAGDVRRLPIRSEAFDLIWCRLVLGHVEELTTAYEELGRVARAAADLIVSDFHPSAVAAGHRRRFKDALGVSREVQHHVHFAEDHVRAARAAGWADRACVDARAGEPERALYVRAGRADLFEAGRAQPLVLAIAFSR